MIARPTGRAVVELAATKIGQSYVLGALAPKDREWDGPWDCAELASWVHARLVGRVAGGRWFGANRDGDAYSGFWCDDARDFGVIVPPQDAMRIPGAVLLRRKREGRVGHVAISDGTGGTIEAHSTRRGVIRGTAAGRRWDSAVLVPGIDYAPAEG